MRRLPQIPTLALIFAVFASPACGWWDAGHMQIAYVTYKHLDGPVKDKVDALLRLNKDYDKWSAAKAGSFAEFMIARSDDVAEDLLSVTDKKAETTKHTTAKKLYLKFRDGAKKNVIEAIPDLGKTIAAQLRG